VPRVGRDLSETVGPVVAAPGEHLDGGVPEMDLDPVAIELDLMHPSIAVRHLPIDVAKAGSMKPGKVALMPPAGGFARG
jgi:hypothetical protein